MFFVLDTHNNCAVFLEVDPRGDDDFTRGGLRAIPDVTVNDWLAEFSFFSFGSGDSRPVVYVATDNPHVFKVQPETPTDPTGFRRLTFAPDGGAASTVRSATQHKTWQEYRKLWPNAK